ncbi:MAG: segregation/condensation protein A [Bacilli bacterium]|nr:segregation/condensation protein A [Bacilli bacterium]
MNYEITIDKFSGPLDLLLHLIKQADMNIFEIKISEITEQYLKYISHMKQLDLNVDSEYITMAAELTYIKSRELLPHDEDDEEEDPQEELINRIIEYQKYKEISETFKTLEEERKEYFTKSPSLLKEFKEDKINISEDISLEDLIKAFSKFCERKEFEKPLKTVITKKEYSVHKRSKEIMNKLKEKKQLEFEELFDIYRKDYVVVTFLSILDLAKQGGLVIKQANSSDKILIISKG